MAPTVFIIPNKNPEACGYKSDGFMRTDPALKDWKVQTIQEWNKAE